MPDFTLEDVPGQTRSKTLRAEVYLAAGQKFADKAPLAAAAVRTVPNGKYARVVVTVRAEFFDGPMPEGLQDKVTGV